MRNPALKRPKEPLPICWLTGRRLLQDPELSSRIPRVYGVSLDRFTLFRDWEVWLSGEERERCGTLRQEADRRRLILGHGMIRFLLSAVCGLPPGEIRLVPDDLGKLSAVCGDKRVPVSFNLTHSGDFVAAALGSDMIGIDIEACKPLEEWESLKNRIFSLPEWQELLVDSQSGTGGPLQAFYRGWTLKEAYIKALGKGFHKPLGEVNITKGKNGIFISDPLRVWQEDDRIYRLDLPGRYEGTLMVLREIGKEVSLSV